MPEETKKVEPKDSNKPVEPDWKKEYQNLIQWCYNKIQEKSAQVEAFRKQTNSIGDLELLHSKQGEVNGLAEVINFIRSH